jgi:ribosomal protein S18 acetylase RimI-like enzyme
MLCGRIQHYLRSVVASEREPVPAGAFVLYVHPTDSHPFLNYAVPVPGASEGDGAELIRVARASRLVPRLEYLESCFPWVEESLSTSGFVREARLRLMTCSPDALRSRAADIELLRVEASSPLVGPMLTVTRAAFGEGPPDGDAVARWEGQAIVALADGKVLGSASWTTVIDGMSEIVAVAVAEQARRRGIGTALTVAATRAAFADGASMALLTPGDDATARVYECAGFSDTTTMLHLRHNP